MSCVEKQHTLDRALDELYGLFQGQLSEVQTLLTEQPSTDKHVSQIVICIEGLEQNVGSMVQLLQTPLATLHPFPIVMTTVKEVLLVCRCVECDHNDVFEKTKKQLGSLFRNTYTMLKIWLDYVCSLAPDTLAAAGLSCSDMIVLMREVADVTLHFDPSLLVLIWKGLGKMICTMRQLFPQSWSIQPIIQQLCVVMEIKTNQCIEAVASCDKILKSIRFLGGLLVKLSGEFVSSCHDYADSLISLLISLHHIVLNLSPSVTKQLEPHILVIREPLMSAVKDSKHFVKLLLNKVGVSIGQHYSWALCLSTLIKLFPKLTGDLQDLVLQARTSRESNETSKSCWLINTAFDCIQLCYVELALPLRQAGLMVNGQPQKLVSLYEELCTHLSAAIMCLSQSQFCTVEECLFGHLMSFDVHCSMMASDLLYFIARSGEPGISATYIDILSRLLLSVGPVSSPALSSTASLLTRLLALRPAAVQKNFLACHAPPCTLWCHLTSLEFLEAEAVRDVSEQLVSGAVELAMDCFKTHAETLTLQTCLWCLWLVYEDVRCRGNLPVSLHRQVSILVMEILNSDDTTGYIKSVVFRIASVLIPILNSQSSIKVFSGLCELLTSTDISPLFIMFTACNFLKQCSSLEVRGDLKDHVTIAIATCFQGLLSQTDWLVQQHALDAFRTFAELTPYAKTVEKCIPKQLTPLVIKFLHKVPFIEDVPLEDIQDYLSCCTTQIATKCSDVDREPNDVCPSKDSATRGLSKQHPSKVHCRSLQCANVEESKESSEGQCSSQVHKEQARAIAQMKTAWKKILVSSDILSQDICQELSDITSNILKHLEHHSPSGH